MRRFEQSGDPRVTRRFAAAILSAGPPTGRRACPCATSASRRSAHVVLEADDRVAALDEVDDGLRADEAAGSGDDGDGHWRRGIDGPSASLGAVSSAAPAVVVEGVSKSFSLPKERVNTFKERALHPLKRGEKEDFHALDDVSFSVPRGEFFGIVGRNGSGKSTLLKCMAGIYATDSGACSSTGACRPSSSSAWASTPTSPRATTRSSTRSCSASPSARPSQRYDRIIDFAGLREFEDLKLKNYSSGMLVRLAFSVMIQVDADILLIDEVLAVGDAAFQQKCFDEFDRLRDEAAHGAVRDARHGLGPALLRPRDGARARQGRAARRGREGGGEVLRPQLQRPGGCGAGRGGRGRGRPARRRQRRDPRGLVRGRARRADRDDSPGRGVHGLRARALQRRRPRPALRRDLRRRRAPPGVRRLERVGHPRDGLLPGSRDRDAEALRSTTGSHPGATTWSSASRAGAAATTCSTTASGWPR